MSDRAPRSRTARLRLVAPLAALALVLAGTTAAFASGAFESNDSGFDSARDIAERGSAPDGVTASTTTTTSSPASVDDRGGDAVATLAEDQSFVTVPDGTTQTFAAGDAGSVTIRRDGATLSVVTVRVNAGWIPDVEQSSGVELEVHFENGTQRVDFNAELEDGAVRIRVRVRDDAVIDDPPVVAPVPEPAPRDDNSGPGSIDDNSGPGNADDRGGDAGDDHSGDDHSGHGSGGSDDGSGHGGSGHD